MQAIKTVLKKDTSSNYENVNNEPLWKILDLECVLELFRLQKR